MDRERDREREREKEREGEMRLISDYVVYVQRYLLGPSTDY